MGTKERKKKGIGEWEFICLFKILLYLRYIHSKVRIKKSRNQIYMVILYK